MSFEEKSALYPWLGSLTRVMDVGILIINTKHDLEFASVKAREAVYCASDEDIGRFWRRLRPELKQAFEHARNAINNGHEVPLEFEFGGRVLRLLVEVHEINKEGCEAYLVLLKDRESIENLQTDLRLSTQFRSTGRLYRAMAHDLRQPLAAIMLYIQLLQDTITHDTPTEETRKAKLDHLDVVKGEVGHLDRSLQFILSETVPTVTPRGPMDLRDLLLDIVKLIGAQAKVQRVSVDVHVAEQPVVVETHRDRLRQAILNLVINAFEAMAAGGKLSVNLSTKDGWATIAIRDSGAGISPEVLRRLFTMHFTTKTTGTGIGLWVARQVVRSYGGDIGVESEVGKGSEFRINLPLTERPAPSR